VPVRFVVFDMDDVLCAYRLDVRLARLAALTGLEAAAIHDAIWNSGFEAAADRGEHDADSYLAGIARLLGRPVARADWLAARAESMAPYPDVLALVRRVGARAGIAVLSNNGMLLRAAIDGIFPELKRLFGPAVYFSAEFGAAKPDPAIYRAVLARHGVAPDEALFVDDLEENVVGARAAGLHAHRFVSAATLAGELIRHGVLAPGADR
jgi:glucose-1-phosphatase